MDALIVNYQRVLLVSFALLPMLGISYLQFYQDPFLTFEQHTFHIIAISVAILVGLFVCYVTWRCYLFSGEVFLRWLAFGFLGFSLVYAPHGFLTAFAHENPWLFLLFGPASRLVMAVCFLMAVFSYGVESDSHEMRRRSSRWWLAAALFLLVDLLVILWANSPWRASQLLRVGMEYVVIILFTISVARIIIQRVHNPLMIIYAIALAWFAQSSLAFTFGLPWNHQWWLAHLVFAGGFLLVSYGVIEAYLSTGSFSQVYSQAELLEELRKEKQRTDQAMVDLQYANQELERLAATDSLTGTANRRALKERAEQEMALAKRHKQPLALILLDLDFFKEINDTYGHPVGDSVLKVFVKRVQELLRPSDILGRVGGEEFAVLLPSTDIQEARAAAERLRRLMDGKPIDVAEHTHKVTLSAGVIQVSPQAKSIDSEFSRADKLLYQAKEAGRNCVVVG